MGFYACGNINACGQLFLKKEAGEPAGFTMISRDVAETLILASRSGLRGAHAFHLGGNHVELREFVAAIDAAVPGAGSRIDIVEQGLPFPDQIASEAIGVLGPVPVTPLGVGVAETAALFEALRDRGALDPLEHGLATATPGPSRAV